MPRQPTQPFVPYAETPPRRDGINPQIAAELAAASSIAMSTEHQFEVYQTAYEEAGRSKEWDSFKFLYRNARDQSAQARLFENVRRRSAELGIEPTMGSPVLMDEFTAAVAGAEAARDAPHLTALMEKAAQGPVPAGANRDELSSREFALLEMDRRTVAAMEANQSVRDYVTSRGATYNSSAWYALGQIFMELLPAEIPIWQDLAHDMQVRGNSGREYVPGEAAQLIREKYTALTPEDRLKFAKDLVGQLNENPYIGDFKEWQIIQSTFTEGLLDQGNPDDIVDRVIGNLSGALDLFVIGDLIRITKAMRTGMLGKTTRALNTANSARAQQFMAELYDRVQNAELAKTWGVSKETIAVSQLPKPRITLGSGDHIPDGVVEEAVRVASIRKDIGDITARSRAVLYTPDEAASAFDQVAKEIEEAVRPRLRPALSTVKLHEDGAGVDFHTVLGRTNTDGFVTLGAARRVAAQYAPNGEDVRILKVDKDGELVEVPAGAAQARGTYYVELKQTAFLRPEDKLLFGDSPVLNNSWLGGTGRYLLTPSAQFDPKVYTPYMNNVLKESALTSKLDAIVMPLYRDLNAKQRQYVGNMWEWTEEFGRKEARLPTFDELRDAFPDSTATDLKGWFQVRLFYDTVYSINNNRLYREWASRGFKTARKGDIAIHGEPVARNQARNAAFDPETQTSRSLNSRELDDLYARGGSIVHTDLPVSAGNRQFHRYVIVDPATGWNLGKLNANPLKYIPGYYPRIYKDFMFVERVVKNAQVDGAATTHRSAIGVAATRQEAQALVDKLTAKNADANIAFEIADDARLRQKDRTAMDLERMQLEGRLFFDERNQTKLYDTHGNPAEVVDPINMLKRSARMVSRQVAVEDLVRTMKSAWGKTYASLLKGDYQRLTSSAVDAELRSVANTAEGKTIKSAQEARAWWDYIRLMEGSTGDSSTWFRRRAIAAAEFLNEQIGNRLPALRRLTTAAVRNAHNFTPVEWMKSLAYFDFLVTRPIRQLVLQGSQHLFLQALSPTYAGRWQMDSMWLLQGAKRRAVEQAGGKTLRNKLIHRNAKLMGLKTAEYERLIEEFDKSGLAQTVNIHSFAGDLPRGGGVTPETAGGRAADKAVATLTARPVRHALERFGFTLGEQYNVAASYMMALKLFREKEGIKDLTKMTAEQWDKVARRGSDLSLAMHRGNAARYQYGFASLPLQFLQFTHKALLVGARAFTFGLAGNRSFTVGEAWKIVAGQALLFGLGAGFGIKPEVEKALSESGFGELVGTEVSDLIAGGVLDWAFDKSLQAMADDPDLDLAFDEFLAPGANVINVARKFVEAAFEMPVSEWLAGPSGTTIGRLAEAASLAGLIVRTDLSEYTPAQEAEIVAEAFLSGIASGYNDFVQARAAHKVGFWLSSTGDPTAIEAKWETVLARGLLGVAPQARYDSFAITNDQKKYEAELKSIAREYYGRIRRLINTWGSSGALSKEGLITQIELEQSILHVLEPEERDFVHTEFVAQMKRDRGQQDGIEYMIAKAVTRGVPPDKALRDKVATTTAITDEGQREALIRMLDQWFAEVDTAQMMLDEHLQTELERAKEAR